MYDMIVIGGGPAALAATFYAAGKQLNVVMVYEDLGGKIGWLESLVGPEQKQYFPGNELVQLLTTQTATHAERAIDDRVREVTSDGPTFHVHTDAHGVLKTRTVIVATGATPLRLDVPGANLVAEGGLGYSITTFAHLVRGKRVAVVGATNRALSGAAELADTAEHVYLVAPRPLSLASPLGHALREHPGVELLEGFEVTRLENADRMVIVTATGQQHMRQLSVDKVFVAMGLVPNSWPVRGLVETDAEGFILVNAFHETSTPGLFAAGDVCSIFSEQVLVAIGDGARAAMSAYDYILAVKLVPGLV